MLWTHTQSTHLCYGGLFVVVKFVKGAWTYKFTNTFKLITYYFIYTHLFVLYVLVLYIHIWVNCISVEVKGQLVGISSLPTV